jgi:hypothetical protein
MKEERRMIHNRHEIYELSCVSYANHNRVVNSIACTRNNAELLTTKNTMKGGRY